MGLGRSFLVGVVLTKIESAGFSVRVRVILVGEGVDLMGDFPLRGVWEGVGGKASDGVNGGGGGGNKVGLIDGCGGRDGGGGGGGNEAGVIGGGGVHVER